MDKQDIFYYAKLNGVPVYFQPEENEVIGRIFEGSINTAEGEIYLRVNKRLLSEIPTL